jgi:hypothetical protein
MGFCGVALGRTVRLYVGGIEPSLISVKEAFFIGPHLVLAPVAALGIWSQVEECIETWQRKPKWQW